MLYGLTALLLLPLPVTAESPTCLTSTIARYRQDPASLSPAELSDVERVLAPRAAGAVWFSYISPSGIFQMHYTNEGIDAVRPKDTDPANGIPDLVEDSAVWADSAWAAQTGTLGYPAPPMPADGTYDVIFKWLPGTILGACGPQEHEGPDHTEIWLRHRFGGFGIPPDELVPGVIAHEVKHAIQYLVNHWENELGWIELDANWVVDYVFEVAANERVIGYSGSQHTNPEQSLDHPDGYASYGDYLWESYLSQKHGLDIMLDFWDIRAASPGPDVLGSYLATQALYGADWGSSYPEFMEWCWFSGSLADPGFGFVKAALYPDVALREPLVSFYPHAAADAVAHLACHHRKFAPGTPSRAPRVLFDGTTPGASLTVSVITGHPDGTFSIIHPALDANGDADYTVPEPWGALDYLAVIVTNSAPAAADEAYVLQVVEEAVTDVDVTVLPEWEFGVRPNPFRTGTSIQFTIPAQGHGELSVYDVRGRVVRSLWSGVLSEGPRTLAWDGRTSAGRPAPAGVYWIRLVTEEGNASRQVTRVR